MQRRVRNHIFDSGAYPQGDRAINPQRKRTAHEFYEWSQHQSSHSIHEGAYLDMLEAEERHMGTSSYPEGHPRRAQAMSGLPRGPLVHPDAGATVREPPARGGIPPGIDPERLLRTGAGQKVPVRVNRFGDTCAHCKQPVGPGEGRRQREFGRWVTVHHPACPNC